MILAKRSFPVYFYGGKYLYLFQRENASHLPPGLSELPLRKIMYISCILIAFSLSQLENNLF